MLVTVREHTKIDRLEERIVDAADGTVFEGGERVSMNCWGFTPAVFPLLEQGLIGFLEAHGSTEKAEFYIPSAVEEMIRAGSAGVKVLPVESPWFGVTYRGDRDGVVQALAGLVEGGDYPSPLG